jgi:hypothetical protein
MGSQEIYTEAKGETREREIHPDERCKRTDEKFDGIHFCKLGLHFLEVSDINLVIYFMYEVTKQDAKGLRSHLTEKSVPQKAN